MDSNQEPKRVIYIYNPEQLLRGNDALDFKFQLFPLVKNKLVNVKIGFEKGTFDFKRDYWNDQH